ASPPSPGRCRSSSAAPCSPPHECSGRRAGEQGGPMDPARPRGLATVEGQDEPGGETMANTLTVIDNRSGKKVELPIEHGAIRAVDLGKLGIVSYDPALLNTAACKSKISYIDGERGILRYRGYPIEELAEKSSFLETAYLIVKGELPTASHFRMRSEEHTSELQSPDHLVCRLLLETNKRK